MRSSNRKGISLLPNIQAFALFIFIAQSVFVLLLLERLYISNKTLQNSLTDNASIQLSLSKCALKNEKEVENLVVRDEEVTGSACLYRDFRQKDLKGHNSSAWDIIDGNMSFSAKMDFGCENAYCRSSWEEELSEIGVIAFDSVKTNLEKNTKWKLERIELDNAAVRANRFVGLEYIVKSTLLLRKSDSEEEDWMQNEMLGSVVVRKRLSPNNCDVSFHANDLKEEEPVYVIVPFTGRIEQLRRFFENFIYLIEEEVRIRLVIAIHGKEKNDENVKSLMEEMKIENLLDVHTEEKLIDIVEVSGDKHGKFSRSIALLDGLNHAPQNALVFYCDVDMKIEKGFFKNCRYNTWKNEQVYYPIMYSLYPYGKEVKEGHGYWRSSSFGMICAFKEDLIENTFWHDYAEYLTGWGGEDTLLYNGFNFGTKISIFRAPEPNLLHRWHPKHCEWNYFIGSCLNTVFENLGSKRFLGWVVAGSGIDVRTLHHEPGGLTFRGFGEYDEFNTSSPQGSRTDAEFYNAFINSGKAGLLTKFYQETRQK